MPQAVPNFSLRMSMALLVIAALVRFLSHGAMSWVAIVLGLPAIFLFLSISFIALHVFLGYILDTRRAQSTTHMLQPSPAKPLAFSTPAAWQAVLTRSQWSTQSPQSLPPLIPKFPTLSATLNDILIMIVRDFVLVWYRTLSPSPSFPMAVSGLLHETAASLVERVSSIDAAYLVVNRILPKITLHIEQFRTSEMVLRGAALERHLTQSEELDLLLASRYAGQGGKLHPAVENLASAVTKQTEEAHLRQLIDKALTLVLPKNAGASKAVKIVAREIVACTVLQPVMEMLADPDFWNKTIDQLAGEAIRQQKLISKVRSILDTQGTESSVESTIQSGRTPRSEDINLRTDPRRFESFLRSISRCDSLLDARRLKNDIIGEIRRTRALLANHEKDDWINGEKTEDVVAYLDRLYTAKRKVEQRIAILGGADLPRQSSLQEPSSLPGPTHHIKLRDVLMNPSSLSYFMEFMDRRNRSLLVQFWLTVESFKNPLESLDSSGSETDDEAIPSMQQSITVKEDMTMLYDLYFSIASSVATLSVSQKHIDTIREFVSDTSGSSSPKERRVRRSVLRAQKEVEDELEQEFQSFEKSDLWFRAIADLEPRMSTRKTPQKPISPTSLDNQDSIQTQDAHQQVGSSQRRRPKFLLSSMQKAESSPAIVNSQELSFRTISSETGSSGVPSMESIHSQQRALPLKLDLLTSQSPDSPTSPRLPLFDDPPDLRSPSLSEVGQEEPTTEQMEAIQAALTDIIADDIQQGTKRRSLSISGPVSQHADHEDRLSTKASSSTHRGLFDDDLQTEGQTDSTDVETMDTLDVAGQGDFQLWPGDLQLSYDIERLAEKISKLQSQDAMLDTLIRKAELTGDAQELRLLNKSKSATVRELRELTFQKTQYEQQEADSRLIPEYTKVSIANSAVSEDEGKSVVRYLIEVQQLAMDGSYASGWVVARRYNEFFNMHQSLKDKYLVVRSLEFPGKRLVTSLSSSFVDTRRIALEKYLQSLVAIPMVCQSSELRTFLSRQAPLNAMPIDISDKRQVSYPGQTIVRHVYRSVAESIDDMLFGPSMLEVMIQRLTRQAAEFAGIVGVGMNDEDLVAQAFKSSGKAFPEEALMKFPGVLKTLEGETSTSSFSAPICDLILAVFELKKMNNWLRRQAIVIILQQVLGGTIERKLRDSVRTYTEEGYLMRALNIFKENMWPRGKLKPPSQPRTAEEKARTRDDANGKLSLLIPDLAANMIGRSNARRGARRMFAVLQNRRLNQHLMYLIMDEIFNALFPETVAP